jgi:hypothetical protein
MQINERRHSCLLNSSQPSYSSSTIAREIYIVVAAVDRSVGLDLRLQDRDSQACAAVAMTEIGHRTDRDSRQNAHI